MPADLPASLAERGFVPVDPGPGLSIDLRYATDRNLLGRPVYRDFDRLILHPIAAEKLGRSVAWLNEHAPGETLLVLDGLRPNRIQRLFWEAVAGGPLQKYVADPAIGSIHGFGLAIDATLLDRDGRECDMGTPFDHFSELAEPQREREFLAAGRLTAAHIANRRRLRAVMAAGGFLAIALEWWHFDALPPDRVRRTFAIVD